MEKAKSSSPSPDKVFMHIHIRGADGRLLTRWIYMYDRDNCEFTPSVLEASAISLEDARHLHATLNTVLPAFVGSCVFKCDNRQFTPAMRRVLNLVEQEV